VQRRFLESMGTVLEQLPIGARVAVIRLRSLGDCVLTTPALEILKRSRPDLRLAVAVEAAFAAVFEGNPHVEAILAPKVAAVAGWKPELAINFHGGTRSALLAVRSGARWRAGFAHFRYAMLYNVRIPRTQEILGIERIVHTAEHLASAMFFLGAPIGEIPPARLYAPAPEAGRPYAVLHPVASAPDKTWPAARFLEVAAELRASWGLDAVFIGGPGQDLSAFDEYRTLCGAPLGEIKRLLVGASAFVGNDSGPAHMAAAFQVPSVVIFGGSDYQRWRPWKAPSEIVIAEGPIADVPTAEVIGALGRLKVAA
jgi:ADP-heptose:LPS heptosyltransferase